MAANMRPGNLLQKPQCLPTTPESPPKKHSLSPNLFILGSHQESSLVSFDIDLDLLVSLLDLYARKVFNHVLTRDFLW